MSTELLNFGTDLYELENFSIRVSADFMQNGGKTTQDLLNRVNVTINEVIADVVITLERYMVGPDVDVEGVELLKSMLTSLNGSRQYIDDMWTYYSKLTTLFADNILLTSLPQMTQTNNFIR